MSLGHACVDVYQGAVAALVPYFVAERAYTYATASGIVLAASLLSSVVQPLFGALADRWAMPWLLSLSALLGGAGVALSGVGGSYALTLAAVAVSGIGVAAYHPEAARVARRVSRGSHTAMSWFSLGGNLGFAAAPLAVSAVVAAGGGLRATPLLVAPSLAGAVLCAAAVRAARPAPTADAVGEVCGAVPGVVSGAAPDPASGAAPDPVSGAAPGEVSGAAPHPVSGAVPDPASGAVSGALPDLASGAVSGAVPGVVSGAAPDPASGAVPGALPDLASGAVSGAVPDTVSGSNDWPSFLRLSGAVVCRSVVFVGLGTFISLYASRRAPGGEVAGTTALFVLYLGGAAGTLAGGRLATRYGRVRVVRWSYALTGLAVAGVVLVPGPLLHLFVALASAGLYVPFSLHITLGQDYLPTRMGTAGGVTLGLTVSVGGLASPLIGRLADATSLRTALLPLIVLPAVGCLFLRRLREPAAAGP
ncbi:MFS transporter [Streptomyces sp. Tue6028]|uniref:MFS transporter n=1 Tax=Streptomyces sp. Tue6028 TaxID=2036037 RepID=UPI000BB343AF|nr:MFS transporter [Streptomyces sp. Tue6028]